MPDDKMWSRKSTGGLRAPDGDAWRLAKPIDGDHPSINLSIIQRPGPSSLPPRNQMTSFFTSWTLRPPCFLIGFLLAFLFCPGLQAQTILNGGFQNDYASWDAGASWHIWSTGSQGHNGSSKYLFFGAAGDGVIAS